MRTHPDIVLTTTLLQLLVCKSVTTIARFYVCSQLAFDVQNNRNFFLVKKFNLTLLVVWQSGDNEMVE